MVGKTVDGDVQPAQPDDAGDGADPKVRPLERAALLDVQLDIGVHAAARPDGAGQLLDRATHESNPFTQRLAGTGHGVQARVGQFTNR